MTVPLSLPPFARGLDYSWGRPNLDAIVASGYSFVCRYFSYGTGRNVGKNLTLGEAEALSAHGIGIVSNWENNKDDFMSGRPQGRADAAAQLAMGPTAGAPDHQVCYFSVDRDPSNPVVLNAGLDYLRGVAEVWGSPDFGAYGGLALVRAAMEAGICRYGWQTYAWSGGKWYDKAQLRQVLNTQKIGGADVDFNEARAADFGQWRIERKKSTVKVSGIPYVQGRNSYSDPDGTKYAIAIHNTSNDATAEEEAHYATTRTDGVSSHFYVDNNSMIQSLDTAARAGHAGSPQGNDNAVAVEITGTNDMSRQWWLDNVAWDLLGKSLAQVCRAYGIPAQHRTVAEMKANAKVKGFYAHDDMRLAWGGTTHNDPGPNFPWDRLLGAVSAALGGSSGSIGDIMTVHDDQVQALYATEFSGGGAGTTSTKGVVPTEFRGSNDTVGNALVSQLIFLVAAATAAATKQDQVLAKLDAISAKLDSSAPGSGATAAEVRTIVDEELDEAFTGADPRGVDSGT